MIPIWLVILADNIACVIAEVALILMK